MLRRSQDYTGVLPHLRDMDITPPLRNVPLIRTSPREASDPLPAFDKGIAAYEKGRYSAAIRYFSQDIAETEKRARGTDVFNNTTGNITDLTPIHDNLPNAYFNRAISYDQRAREHPARNVHAIRADRQRALADYTRTLAIAPEGFDRAHAEKRVRDLTRILGGSAPAPMAVPPR